MPDARGLTVRAAAVLLVAGYALHDLRYRLAFGGHADHALAEQGHGYLAAVAPLCGGAVVVGLALVLTRLGRRGRARHVRVTRLWPAATLGLLAIFAGQELIEGALSPGHPAGLHGVFGHGGWIALPLAVALGAGVAAACGVVAALERRALSAPHVEVLLVASVWRDALPALAPHRRRRDVAGPLAGRGPPMRLG